LQEKLYSEPGRFQLIDEKKLMAMGIAALLPGITAIRELISQQENEYRDLLHNLQSNGLELLPKRRGRPSNASKALLEAQVKALLPEPEKTPKKSGHGETLPHQIGNDFTRAGAAAYLGYETLSGFDLLRRKLDIPSKIVKNPDANLKRGGRVKVIAFSRAALDAAKKQMDRESAPALGQEGSKHTEASKKALSSKQKNYWFGMTKEQRAAEVARRMGSKKAAKKSDLTRRGTKPARSYGWANMTPEERSAEMQRRQAVSRGEAQGKAQAQA